MRQIAVCADYDQLQFALRQWADELGLSRETIDERAGLTDGHAAKLLRLNPVRRLGPETLGAMLRALGVVLILAPLDDELQRISDAGIKRKNEQVRRKRLGKHEKAAIIKDFQRQIGRKGGLATVATMTPAEWSFHCRKAIAKRYGYRAPTE